MYEDIKLKLTDVANMVLQRKVGIVEASRWFVGIRYDVENTEIAKDLLPFVGIDSCTDHFPLGSLRDKWSKEGLEKSDKEFEEAEKHFQSMCFEACEVILEKYGKDI